MPNDQQTATAVLEFATARDVADELGCSISTVARKARAGEIPVAGKLRGLRGAYLFHLDAVKGATR